MFAVHIKSLYKLTDFKLIYRKFIIFSQKHKRLKQRIYTIQIITLCENFCFTKDNSFWNFDIYFHWGSYETIQFISLLWFSISIFFNWSNSQFGSINKIITPAPSFLFIIFKLNFRKWTSRLSKLHEFPRVPQKNRPLNPPKVKVKLRKTFKALLPKWASPIHVWQTVVYLLSVSILMTNARLPLQIHKAKIL